jgi:hypothetical protein
MMHTLKQLRPIPRSRSRVPLPECADFPDLPKSTPSGNSHSQLSRYRLAPASLPLPHGFPPFPRPIPARRR